MSYYTINSNVATHLTSEDIMQHDRNKINNCSKHYTPIFLHRIGKEKSITLYTNQVSMSANEYVTNYNTLPNIYGTNALNESDIMILNHLNQDADENVPN